MKHMTLRHGLPTTSKNWGDAIGYGLEFIDREVSVGPYFADILAKDMNSDTKVVIENQLEKTNHDHLGKCITYSSVLNARIVVWISPQFTDEHKKAIECAALPSGILLLPALSSLATSSTN